MGFLESLESRVMFTSSAAHVAATIKLIKTDGTKLKATVHALGPKLAKAQKTINADLAHLGVTATQATLIQNLATASSALTTDLATDLNFYLPELNRDAAQLVSQEKLRTKNPTDSQWVTETRATDAALGTISTFANQPFTYNSKAPAIYAALDAIAGANPSSTKVAADVKSLKTSLKAAVTKAETAAGKLYDTDIGNTEALYPY